MDSIGLNETLRNLQNDSSLRGLLRYLNTGFNLGSEFNPYRKHDSEISDAYIHLFNLYLDHKGLYCEAALRRNGKIFYPHFRVHESKGLLLINAKPPKRTLYIVDLFPRLNQANILETIQDHLDYHKGNLENRLSELNNQQRDIEKMLERENELIARYHGER
jgi:hypothetical protein